MTNTENSCKCNSGSTSETTYGVGVTSAGTWAPGGWYNPSSYTYSSGYNHAPKCQNCGFCPCCGKADIPGNYARPDQPDFIGK